jgi:hypothetical protein
MLSVKSKPLLPISVLERASAARAESGQPSPTMPEDMSAEQAEAQELDPTGIQGTLKETT